VPARLGAILVISLVLAACGGTSPGPASTSGAGATEPPGSVPAIDFSQVDVCQLVPAGTAEALTGETGFTADGSSSASQAKCFWGVPRAGVPQYLEVEVSRRSKSLDGYGISFNGNSCPGVTVAAAGAEAVGAVCTDPQTKVWLAAMDSGLFVQVLVNEPKGTLTPADLAAAANAILASIR
jgi:hypothetical protein